MWMLLSATFSLPGRTGAESLDSIDALALFKVGVRAFVFTALAMAIFSMWRRSNRAAVSRTLRPLAIFVCWAIASCLWSPLPAFSAGQALTVFALFLLATAMALAWRPHRHTSAILKHASLAFMLVCATLLAVHVMSPGASPFQRLSESDSAGAVGVFHPTMAGGTASLGIVLVTACRLMGRWPWTRVLFWPALGVFSIVVVLAASRTAMVLAVLLTALLFCFAGDRKRVGALVLTTSLAGILYPIVDPGLEAAQRVIASSFDYARRGESTASLRSLTGRTELWAVLQQSFVQSPVIGHGYFVTSETGRIDVWAGPGNRSAHNIFLQVAVTTGLVGLVLFVAGLWRLIAAACRLGSTAEGRQLRRVAAALGVWYLGWSGLNESFMGPLSPESVLAFALFGLVAGAAGSEAS
jgi:O-antigen ligase